MSHRGWSGRPHQYIAFTIDHHYLERVLGIPRDHRIARIELTGEHQAPGINIIVEGPAGQLTATRNAVCYDNLEHWLRSADEVREAALAQLGPYEW